MPRSEEGRRISFRILRRASAVLLLLTAASGADFGWTQTARVFLIDAYQPPFEPRLEYDARALAETMVRMHANTVRISTMGKYALIPGVRFTPHPELGRRDVLAETIAAARPRGIRVVPYISTGHKLAWTMVTRDYPEYGQKTRPGGGPDRTHFFVGEDHGTVCWNTPYRQAYLDLVERVARDYDIDGMYFDTWRASYFWPGRRVCYCDGCRNGFKKLTGQDLPWHERDSDYTPADRRLIERYHGWLQDSLAETALQVRRLVRAHKNIPLIFNVNNAPGIDATDPRILRAMDAFLYERGPSLLERAEGVSLARAAGLGVWPYVGVYNHWPRVIGNAFDYQREIFTTAMFGGAPIIAQPHAYVHQAENREFVEYPFRILKEHEREFAGFENVPYVAVVYGYRTPPGHGQTTWWWRTDSRTSSLGAFAACLHGHVQVTSAHESLLDEPEKLGAYRVLYLADVTYLPESRLENIRRFVREGGGLVATYSATLFDGGGQRRKRFALEDLLRAIPLEPAGELAATLASYRSIIGGPYDLYLAERSRPGRLISLWTFEPVRALEGGEVVMDIVTGDGPRPILPGVIVSEYGKGRVVYCATAVDALFQRTSDRALGDTIRALVARAARAAPPVEVQAPPTLAANLTRRGNTLVLHLANWTGDENSLAPVENVRVTIPAPAGRRVARVSLLEKAPHRQQRKGAAVEVILPRVNAYQALRVELE